jgi:transcriptional regulator with XRE-family HTH domain
MRTVKSGQPITVLSRHSPRAQAGRRVQAARLIADISLRDAAHNTGIALEHLAAVERGTHPLTSTDCRDLGALLGVPPSWLAHGFTDEAA